MPCLKKSKFLTLRPAILFTNLLLLVATVCTGKAERNLPTRLSEHSGPLNRSISKHLWFILFIYLITLSKITNSTGSYNSTMPIKAVFQ